MSLKEKVKSVSGQRRYDDGYTCPVLGPVIIRNLTEAEFQDLVILWCFDQKWERIPDRAETENARMVQVCLVDGDHNREFADDMDDLQLIAGLDREIFQPLYERVNTWQRRGRPANPTGASATTT